MPFTIVDILFRLEGRLGRLAYLGYSTLILITTVALTIAIAGLFQGGSSAGALLGFLIMLVTLVGAAWMNIAVATKRLHDMNLSGFNLVWVYGASLLASGLGAIDPTLGLVGHLGYLAVSLWLLFTPGTAGANRFGPAHVQPVATTFDI